MNQALQYNRTLKVGIVGNPNCGKTTLFNKLTGINQKTGNWPGVTVEQKTGHFSSHGRKIELIDLPGIYSLTSSSLDEKVARDFILEGEADLIVNIVDACNLQRSLYLTLHLIETGKPIVLGLNMMDLLQKQGIQIDVDLLSRELGIPVVLLSAKQKKGLDGLLQEITKPGRANSIKPYLQNPVLKKELGLLHRLAQKLEYRKHEDLDWISLKLLELDRDVADRLAGEDRKILDAQRKAFFDSNGVSLEDYIGELRIEWITDLVKRAIQYKKPARESITGMIDRVALNKYLGLPLFLFSMYLVFWVSIALSDPFINLIDSLAGLLLVDGLGYLLNDLMGLPWARMLLAEGVGSGIQTVLTFIPPIGLMFLCLSILEDSGYMARATFVADRFIGKIGLPGKAVVPMVIGFGCTVPAAMATRTLEEERDRRMALAMVPFMSCGAKLPVYALFAAAFFPSQGQNIVFALYLIGIAVALGTGLLIKSTVFYGKPMPLLIELPVYHVPSLVSVLSNTWQRLKRFLWEAGKIIVLIVTCLSILNSVGTDGSFGNQDSENSMLSAIGKTINPIFYPIGIKEDNWPATVGIFTGIFAKEAIVGTLDALYSQQARSKKVTDPNAIEPTLVQKAQAVLVEFSEDLSGLAGGFGDPAGIGIDYSKDQGQAAKELEVEQSAFGVMVRHFDGRSGAFAYLLWILLYAPCVAATAAIRREGGGRWTLFTLTYMTLMAWSFSTAFYQATHFTTNPLAATGWIFTAVCVVGLLAIWIKLKGRQVLVESDTFEFQASCESCKIRNCH